MKRNWGQTYALHRLHRRGPAPPKSEFESRMGHSFGPGSAMALIDNAMGTWACFAISDVDGNAYNAARQYRGEQLPMSWMPRLIVVVQQGGTAPRSETKGASSNMAWSPCIKANADGMPGSSGCSFFGFS